MVKKIILILFISVVIKFLEAQEKTPIQYVYHQTTSIALIELEDKLSGDQKLYKNCLQYLSATDKILLSTEEYAPINKRILLSATLKKDKTENIEIIKYAENAKLKYISVNELIHLIKNYEE